MIDRKREKLSDKTKIGNGLLTLTWAELKEDAMSKYKDKEEYKKWTNSSLFVGEDIERLERLIAA